MRIISGEFKGRKLYTPEDDRVRPTSDKVKEAVFSMIATYIPDSVVFDIFSGTGSLGLEAISRGAQKAYFADIDRRSIAMVRANVKHCKAEEYSTIICSDYRSAIGKVNDDIDVIFLDPPYKAGLIEDCILKIIEEGILVPNGIIVVEHSTDVELPNYISDINLIKEKRYGRTCISIFKKIIS